MKNPRRYKIQCLSCKKIFNNDYKTSHEQNIHGGKHVKIKIVGAPENPFEASIGRKMEEEEVRNLDKVKVSFIMAIFDLNLFTISLSTLSRSIFFSFQSSRLKYRVLTIVIKYLHWR